MCTLAPIHLITFSCNLCHDLPIIVVRYPRSWGHFFPFFTLPIPWADHRFEVFFFFFPARYFTKSTCNRLVLVLTFLLSLATSHIVSQTVSSPEATFVLLSLLLPITLPSPKIFVGHYLFAHHH